MTLEFQKRPIIEQEEFYYEPYIGYINPKGEFINYNKMFGEYGHDGWINNITDTFLRFVSFATKGTSIKAIKQDTHYDYCKEEFLKIVEYIGIDNYITRGFSSYPKQTEEELIKKLNHYLDLYIRLCMYSANSEKLFICDLLLFFKNAYSNHTFFDTIGRKFEVESEKNFYINYPWFNKQNNKEYIEYLQYELMQYFKDIVVMYLGYDSIERFKPNGEVIVGGYKNFYYEDALYSYPEPMPRIITTSCLNINERFYNYLLMNWSIHRVPRYFWNENSKKYEKESNIISNYQTEKEERLEEEIKAIKRLVPIQDRYQYFR